MSLPPHHRLLAALAVAVALAAGALVLSVTLNDPAATADQTPLTFAVWGDCRAADSGTVEAPAELGTVARSLASRHYSFSIGLGDYTYPTTADPRSLMDARYASFLQVSRPLRKVRVRYVPGNHELLGDQTARAAYHDDLGVPSPDWRRMDRGSLHILLLSASEPPREGLIGYYGEDSAQNSPEAAWLVRQLRGIAVRSRAAWIIVAVHYPLQDPKSDDPWYTDGERGRLEELFHKYGVDAVLQGHVHFYRRHVAPDGITYLTQGTAGAPVNGEEHPPADGNDRAQLSDVLGYTLFTRTSADRLRGVTYAAPRSGGRFTIRDRFSLTDLRAE